MTRLFKTVSLFTLSLTHVLVWGQSLNGKISGLISDSGGAAISQVAVTVWNEETGAQRRLVTGSSGIYVVAELRRILPRAL
jgi:hypothetical protein